MEIENAIDFNHSTKINKYDENGNELGAWTKI